MATALFVAAVVVPLFRQQGVPAWATLWAEDGAVYYRDIAVDGVGAVFRGYDGYVQFLPRLLMLPTTVLPVEQVARWAALAACVTQAAIAALVYRWSGDHVASRPIRLAIAAMYVVAPQMGFDGTANAANVLAPLMAAVPWALLSRRDGPLDVAGRTVLVLVAGLSSVLALVFIPLGALVAWRRRARPAVTVAGALAAGVVIQQLFMRFSAPRHPPAPNDLLQLPTTTALNVFGSWLLGMAPLVDLWLRLAYWLLVLTVVTGVLVLLVAQVGASRQAKLVAAIFAAYAPLTYVIPVWVNGSTAVGLTPDVAPMLTHRYAVAPAIFLVAATAVLLDSPDPSRHRSLARIGRVVLLVHLVLVLVTSFRFTSARSYAVPWEEAVTTARAVCSTSTGVVPVPIAPDDWWSAVPCDRLVPSGR
jgi:hypothetical protein